MLFNSFDFLVFFLVVTPMFFLLPHRARWALLLAASCFFYMYFKPVYLLILAFTIVVDYYAGIFIARQTDNRKRKLFLLLSIVANLGVLVFFKYFNFINDNLTNLFSFFGTRNPIPALEIILPIGLSFHTFQAMSYTIEVYRGNQKPEKHFGIYALYVMFYPQLVAGPIERPQNILHQFHEKKHFSFDNALEGSKLILFGLFKKVVIADRLAVYVNQVYSDVDNYTTIPILIAVIFFSFQIYCDFSGYSDIARGTAKFMGYDLMLNFNRPYLAQSISEFWTRWHISLSTWFKDYLYIPLGGNRVGKYKWFRNLLIVFLLSGLWHGASWNFVIWGALHGIYLISGIVFENFIKKTALSGTTDQPSALRRLVNQLTVFALVSFAWIFFRADNFNHAVQIIKGLFSFNFSFSLTQICAEKGPLNLFLSFVVLALLALALRLPLNLSFRKFRFNYLFLTGAIILILFLGKDATGEFIYFQF